MIAKLTNVSSRKRRRKSFRFMFVPSGSRRLGLGVNQRLRVNAFSDAYAAPPGLVHRRLPRNSPYIAADNARQGEWNLDRALPRSNRGPATTCRQTGLFNSASRWRSKTDVHSPVSSSPSPTSGSAGSPLGGESRIGKLVIRVRSGRGAT